MLMKKKSVVVLLIAVLTLASALNAADKAPDSFENTSILVEAFVVKVSTAALVEAGVNPIAKSPEGISITKILWCLRDSDKGQVLSGAKINCQSNRKANSEQKKTVYIKYETGITAPNDRPNIPRSVRYDSYSERIDFSVEPRVIEEGIAKIEFVYSETTFEQKKEEASGPLDAVEYNCSGTFIIKSGEPQIVGATQNADSVVFLVVTATIQSPK